MSGKPHQMPRTNKRKMKNLNRLIIGLLLLIVFLAVSEATAQTKEIDSLEAVYIEFRSEIKAEIKDGRRDHKKIDSLVSLGFLIRDLKDTYNSKGKREDEQ